MEARAITGWEFDRALDKAERLLDSWDRSQSQLRLTTALISVSVLVTATLLAVVAASATLAVTIPVLAVAAAGLGLAAFWLNRYLRALHVVSRRDERAMLEVIDVLRELLPDIARAERWGPARYQITTARVSRFPVGRRGTR